MRILSWFLRLVLFLLLFGLALNNLEPVTLHLLFGTQWHAPMIVLLLTVFTLGAVLGVLALLPSWIRHRRRATKRPDKQLADVATSKRPTAASEFPQQPIDRPIDGV